MYEEIGNILDSITAQIESIFAQIKAIFDDFMAMFETEPAATTEEV